MASRNGTFLHRRGFMEYHADRFVDASVVVRDETGHVLAVLPANRLDQRVISHGGLTYGGLIYSHRLKQAGCIDVLERVVAHYRDAGTTKLTYKAIPQVFHRSMAQEDLYALTRMGAQLSRRDVSTVVDLKANYHFTKGRTWAVNKGRKEGIEVRRQLDPKRFHGLLREVLSHHGASPVHSVEELRLLMGLFPDEILLFEATAAGELVAGVLVFDFGHAVHTQYLANSLRGRDIGALDYLIAELMKLQFADRRYFSFGISTEHDGTVLNEGLIAQKEGFGGVSVCHDFYELAL
jgi:hypothetical protein